MPAAQAQKNDLPEILQVHEGQYLVENQKGKSFVVVSINDQGYFCGCPGFAKSTKKNPAAATCKHIESAMNGISKGCVESISVQSSDKPQLDPRFIIRIDGQEFVKFQGLLDLGHQKGISQIEVEPMQLPADTNGHLAVCKATIIGKAGESFTDIGDSSPQNTNSRVSKHLLRIASTRAIARALRAFVNVGLTAVEELSDLNDLADNGNRKKDPKIQSARSYSKGKKNASTAKGSNRMGGENSRDSSETGTETHKAAVPAPKERSNHSVNSSGHPTLSEAQRRAILNIGHRKGIPMETLQTQALESYGVEIEHLTSRDAAGFIAQLQRQAP